MENVGPTSLEMALIGWINELQRKNERMEWIYGWITVNEWKEGRMNEWMTRTTKALTNDKSNLERIQTLILFGRKTWNTASSTPFIIK